GLEEEAHVVVDRLLGVGDLEAPGADAEERRDGRRAEQDAHLGVVDDRLVADIERRRDEAAALDLEEARAPRSARSEEEAAVVEAAAHGRAARRRHVGLDREEREAEEGREGQGRLAA